MQKYLELENNINNNFINSLEKLSKNFTIIDFLDDKSKRVINKTIFFNLINQYSSYLKFFSKKQKIIFPLKSSTENLALVFALINRGFFPILINPFSKVNYIKKILVETKTNLLLVDEKLLKSFSSNIKIINELEKNRLFIIELKNYCYSPITFPSKEEDIGILTSGTTSSPKVVTHQLASLLNNGQYHAKAINLNKNHKVLIPSALNYSYNFVAGFLSSIHMGCTVVLHNNILSLETTILKTTPNVVLGTPTTITNIHNLSDFKIICIGGDTIHSKIIEYIFIQNKEVTIYVTYGLTEAGPRVSTFKITLDTFNHTDSFPLGKPIGNVKFHLEKQENNIYELYIESDTLMLGYLNNELETKHVLKNKLLATGDLFKLKDNKLFFFSRKKGLICRGGENISLPYIEKYIFLSGLVQNVLVKGEKDMKYGEVPVAYVIPEDEYTEKKIIKFLKKNINNSNIPKKFIIVNKLNKK
jgi:long-chain acyl-CoA synthetase